MLQRTCKFNMAVLLATKLPGLVENVRHSRKAQNKMTGP